MAPGSPWKTIFLLCRHGSFRYAVRPHRQVNGRAAGRAPAPGPRACRRRAARCRRSSTSMRMPASSARSCSSFSRCSSGDGGRRDEARERRAAIGVEPDMVIERPVAGGRGGAGEIERAQPPLPRSACHDLHHVRVGALLRARDLGRQRARCRRPGRRAARARRAMSAGASVGRSPCTLTMMSARPLRIGVCSASKMRSEPEAWSAARHHRAAAGLLDAGGDRLRIGRDHDRPDVRRLRAAHHVHDHRLAGDIGQRLAGQPGRGHAGRDQDENVGDRPSVVHVAGRGRPLRQMPRGLRRLYGLPGARQTGYLCAAAVPRPIGCRSAADAVHVLPRALRRWTPSK